MFTKLVETHFKYILSNYKHKKPLCNVRSFDKPVAGRPEVTVRDHIRCVWMYVRVVAHFDNRS